MKHLSCRQAYWMFYTLALVSVALPIMLMYIHLRGNPCIVESMVNAFLLMIPYFFLGKNWRWTTLLLVWMVALFFLTNTWYWRFFNDFIPLSNYLLLGNVGSEVIGTTIMLMKAKDVAFLLPPVFTTTVYFILLKEPLQNYITRSIWRFVLPVAGIVVFVLCYSRELKNNDFAIPQVSPWVEYNQHGLVGYVIKESGLYLRRTLHSREVSEIDMKVVKQYNDNHSLLATDGVVTSIGGG